MKMLTSTDHLFLAIFHEQYSFEGDPKYDAADYLKRYKVEIKAIGRALEYLDLAQQNKGCGLGWKPTPYLLTIVAINARRTSKDSKKPMTNADRAVSALIVDAATGAAQDPVYCMKVSGFVPNALIGLGLMRYDVDGEEKPTRLLRELFWNAYMERRWEAE
jgi:hypothetical protein